MSCVYKLCAKCKVYLLRAQFIVQSTVYFATVQSMSHNYSLCAMITVYVPKITVYVPSVPSLSQEYILCPKSVNYVPRVQSLSQEYILYSKSIVASQKTHIMSQ